MGSKLVIYNSFTGKKEPFVPIKEGEVGLYVCGITVYDYCHIGHARVFIAFDVVVRFLRAIGCKVTYVRNITDIDDKIINRANELGVDISEITEQYTAYMHEDALLLGTIAPDLEPRATENIAEIVQMIEALLDRGFAYIAKNGDVYFAVDKYPAYGELSKQDVTELKAGARVEVDQAKQSALDFVLWKKAKNNEPSYSSPWGLGRPGWHIECSAMSSRFLGETFDLHGGGHDLLFPHHENERAQAECANASKFVNTWMHVGFVQVDKEKMSKSLGNFFTIREVVEQFNAEVVRYLLISSHYRSQVNYSLDNMIAAKNSLDRLYNCLRGLNYKAYAADEVVNLDSIYAKAFVAAMQDDFNTPEAIAVLFELSKQINQLKLTGDLVKANEYAAILTGLAGILALLKQAPEQYAKQGITASINEAEIARLIAKREEAKHNKDYAMADAIRAQLAEQGIALEDTPEGTIWRAK